MKKHSSKSLTFIPAALCLSFLLLAINAKAQVPYYWDINGASAGASNGDGMPNGDWDDMSAGGFWTTDATGMTATGPWVEGNTPVFSALNGTGATTTDATGSYTITVGTGHTIAGMQTAPGSGPVTVSGAGPLQIASGMQQFISTNLTINAPLTDPTVGAPGGLQTAAGNNLSLFGINTFSGGLNLNGGSTYINSASSVGAASGTISSILGGASPVFSAFYSAVNTVTLNNPFSIATANAGIVFIPATTTPLTLSGNFDVEQDFYCRNNGPGTSTGPGGPTGLLTISGNITGTGGMILSCNGDNNSTIALYGANTYTGKTISDPNGQTRILINFNTAQPIGSGIANSLGEPPDAATGQIDLGHPFNATTGFADALRYTGSGDSTTDRIINNANTGTAVGGMWLFAEGAGAITYSGNITASSGSTASRTLILQGSSTAMNTISGSIQDSTGGTVNSINVTKESPSTWRLLGNNTFTGSLTVQNTTGLGGTSTLLLGGANVYAGNTTVSSGSLLRLAAANPIPYGSGKSPTLIVSSGATFDLNGYDCTINNFGTSAGTIDCSTGTGTLTVGVLGTVNANKLPTGVIQNSGGVLNMTFAQSAEAGNVNVTSANTYTGNNTVQRFVLQINSDGATPGDAANLGAVPSSFVANNIVLDHDAHNGDGTVPRGYLRANANLTLHANRGIYLGNTGGYTGAGGCIQAKNGTTIQVDGVISGPGAFWAGPAASVAGGTCVLNAVNTYSGGTYCGSGALKMLVNGAIPTGSPLTMGASHTGVNGTFANLNGTSQTIGPLASTTGFGTTVADIPQLQFSGSGTLTIIQTNTTTFNGAIRQNSVGTSGNLVLDATSTGTLTLGQVNDYSGSTTINGGTLEINAANGIASSPTVTVANGGVLKLDFNTALKSTATLNLATTPNAGTVNLNFSGTQTISALNFGATSMAAGTWGRIGSGALHESAVFDATGNGLLNVTSSTITPTSTSVSSISGTTLSYNIGAGNWFVLLGTNNVAAPLSLWTRVATNGSTPGSFTIPAVGSQPQMFYRVKSE